MLKEKTITNFLPLISLFNRPTFFSNKLTDMLWGVSCYTFWIPTAITELMKCDIVLNNSGTKPGL
jgi:hypothetical protein